MRFIGVYDHRGQPLVRPAGFRAAVEVARWGETSERIRDGKAQHETTEAIGSRVGIPGDQPGAGEEDPSGGEEDARRR